MQAMVMQQFFLAAVYYLTGGAGALDLPQPESACRPCSCPSPPAADACRRWCLSWNLAARAARMAQPHAPSHASRSRRPRGPSAGDLLTYLAIRALSDAATVAAARLQPPGAPVGPLPDSAYEQEPAAAGAGSEQRQESKKEK